MFTRILSAQQTHQADDYTIKNEPVSSVDLMERAAEGLAQSIVKQFPLSQSFIIFCGKGNNGGDGLALARMLNRLGFKVRVYILKSDSYSNDFKVNLDRLEKAEVEIHQIASKGDLPEPDNKAVVVDGLLGSGLTGSLRGFIAEIVDELNSWKSFKIAIDIPTGLFADNNAENDLEKVFKSDLTLTFQFPKLSMMHIKTAALCGDVQVINIHLHPAFLKEAESRYFYLDQKGVKDIFRPRQKHSYKGTYGHALLIAGSHGSIGAAIMSSKASLRAGAGMLTVALPVEGVMALHANLPEAMIKADKNATHITRIPDLEKFTGIAIGPGLGQEGETAIALEQLLDTITVPLVIDADGLNIISAHPHLMDKLPENTILTPHPGEFKRLIHADSLGWDYLEKLRDFCMKYKVITILKDSITAVCSPGGDIYFTNTGSAALASPGSGDVLTGILLGLVTSGYDLLNAACLGVYLHGRAGTMAGKKYSLEAALATDVIDQLGFAFREFYD